MKAIQQKLLNLPIFYKIFIANSLLILSGAGAGAWLAREVLKGAPFELYVFLVALAVFISVLANFFLIRSALFPLSALGEAVKRFQAEESVTGRPSPGRPGDPEVSDLISSLGTMLKRLEENTRTLEEERNKCRSCHILTSSVINAQEEERKRIARELHDETSQVLTTLIISLETIEKGLPREMKEIQGRILHLKDLTSETLEEIHKLALNLRPTILDDMGLIAAIQWYAKEHLAPQGISSSVQITGGARRLQGDLETALFRIVQEATTNVTKYARARTVTIFMDFKASSLSLRIQDDGRGFDVEQVLKEAKISRLGLFGMRERVALFNGSLRIYSRPGEGTTVLAEVPLEYRGVDVYAENLSSSGG